MSGEPLRPLSRPSIPGRFTRRRNVPLGITGGPLRIGSRSSRSRPSADGKRRGGRLADLVEEGEGAGVAFEDVAEELPHRRLDLALRRGGQSKTGERLDVLALVRLQQLQRV